MKRTVTLAAAAALIAVPVAGAHAVPIEGSDPGDVRGNSSAFIAALDDDRRGVRLFGSGLFANGLGGGQGGAGAEINDNVRDWLDAFLGDLFGRHFRPLDGLPTAGEDGTGTAQNEASNEDEAAEVDETLLSADDPSTAGDADNTTASQLLSTADLAEPDSLDAIAQLADEPADGLSNFQLTQGSAVPEPSSLGLLAIAAAAAAARRRRT